MKILMVARRYPPDVISGTETVFENLYKQACARHEVRLVVGYRNDRSLVPDEAVAVDLRSGGKATRYGRLWWQTLQEIKTFQPDVVLSNSIEAPVARVPTACIVHDLNFGKAASEGLSNKGRVWFYRAKARKLARIITVSDAMAGQLAHQGLPQEKIVAIQNGVDLTRFVPPTRTEADTPIQIVYPSRIIHGKGQHVAIDAVGRLPKPERRNVHLSIVGTAPDPVYLDRLKIEAYEQPVSIHVDVPDIVVWYQKADIVVFPTLMGEGFGFTAVEGMACGRPVIWSDQPAIREATGGIGVPVPMDDAHALRQAIRQLIDHPEERAQLGQEGLAFVRERYDWAEVWRRYEAVLEGMR